MNEDACKSCGPLTKYRRLTCHNFVCNMSLECSIFAPETHPGWKAGKSVALCKLCDQKEYVLVEDDVDQELNEELTDDEAVEESVEFDCASRGYYVYRKVWLQKKKELFVAFKKSNVYDLYVCGIYLLTEGTIFGKCLVGHIPRELLDQDLQNSS